MKYTDILKYQLFLTAVLLLLPNSLQSQSGIISFAARNSDNGKELSLDSILISNITRNIDTMIYDGSRFEFGVSTGIDDHISESSQLLAASCFPSLCEDFTNVYIQTDGNQALDFKVFGLNGQSYVSYSGILDAGQHTFKILTSPLSPGIYLIGLSSGGKATTLRFVKSGAISGGSCRIDYTGSEDLNILAQKNGQSATNDYYRFIGYYQNFISDTLNSIVPENGKKYWFRFSLGRDAGYDACDSNSIWYDWMCYPMDYLDDWGMGSVQQEYFHNDRSYSWYIDQKYTGPHSNNNCGPSSVTMAALWSDSTFELTCEDARETYRPDGGWWYTNNIVDYLNLHSIPNSVVSFTDSIQIAEIIKSEMVIILCLNTAHLRRTIRGEDRLDRFYSYADGHFLVVKGVRTVDNHMYFETYDPNNWGMTYYDSSQKGENRHYRASDITAAVQNWWNYLIVVSPKKPEPHKFSLEGIVDSSEIEHQRGR